MRPGEFAIEPELVRHLVDTQFPQWSSEPIQRVASAGTDNAMFRLGESLVVRLPRLDSAVDALVAEQAALPFLDRHVSIQIPEVVAAGLPTPRFGHPWSIYRWIDGTDAYTESVANEVGIAAELGTFVRELRSAPPATQQQSFRGGPLQLRDEITRRYVQAVTARGELPQRSSTAFWDHAMNLPDWSSEQAWLHADLLPGNVLIRDGELEAVIDFGGCGLGDPSCDLMAAWALFTGAARDAFLREGGPDIMTSRRGRAWAFSVGVGAWEFYQDRNVLLANAGKRAALEALQSWEDGELG